MSTTAWARRSKLIRIDPTPNYPHIALGLHLTETNPPQFHWLIFIPDAGQSQVADHRETKLHAVQTLHHFGGRAAVSFSWQFEAVPFILATSGSIAAAAIIGELKDKTVAQLIELLRSIPMSIPAVDSQREPVFTCRVWVREALRRMHGAGFVHCPDVDALEQEMWNYGLPAAAAVVNNTLQIATLRTARNSRAV